MMNSADTMIAVPGGYQTLSKIENLYEVLEKSRLYEKWFDGRHTVYIPLQDKYCIKKTVVWSRSAADDPFGRRQCEQRIGKRLGLLSSFVPDGDHVIAVYDRKLVESQTPGAYDLYLCMEKVSVADQTGSLCLQNPAEVREVCMAVCDLLETFYKNNGEEIHSNINHRNIFKHDGSVILGNCSLSGVKNEILYYNAPEILRGEVPTKASDVYSLGVWLYEMLKPSSDRNIFAEADRYGIADTDIRIKEKAPGALLNIIRKAVDCDPANRYPSPAALKEALAETAVPKKEFPWRKAGIGAAAILLCAGIGFYAAAGYDPGAKEIRSMIESHSYSLAYKEICDRQPGDATDKLIIEYINGCLEERDYQRAAQIIPEFSQEMFDDPAYLEDLIETFRKKEKMNVLLPVLERIYTRSDAVADIIDNIG